MDGLVALHLEQRFDRLTANPLLSILLNIRGTAPSISAYFDQNITQQNPGRDKETTRTPALCRGGLNGVLKDNVLSSQLLVHVGKGLELVLV